MFALFNESQKLKQFIEKFIVFETNLSKTLKITVKILLNYITKFKTVKL